MPQDLKNLLVAVGLVIVAVGASVALILATGGRDWVVNSSAWLLCLALFVPADWPEGPDA